MEEQALLDSYQFGAESRSLGQFSHPYEQVGVLIFVLNNNFIIMASSKLNTGKPKKQEVQHP